MSSRVLITGAGGQLGHDLVSQFSLNGYQVFGLTRQDLDITDQDMVKSVFEKIKPDLVIHAAAYTAVDQAESDVDDAFRVNAIGTRNVAVEANRYNAKVVYVSTDYVFNGQAREPINEFSPVAPIGIYGQSKLAGENYIRDLCNQFFIVRTSWVYGSHGNNFVKTMLKLGQEKEEIGVVADQIGSPTYTVDLAKSIVEIGATEKFGIYHVSNSGSCSWYEFAKAIFEIGGIDVKVKALSTEEFPRPAKRPAYSVFDHMGLRLNGFKKTPHWRDALKDFLQT
ncbi:MULTISPECIES: dTDP-4-dehydrorhamnose reductase [Shouchella]|uniref:dTDP-4-dehydrorhamnose reductase n=1 Tax=Shouchella TaxID=2893057 RepID=UPI000BA6DC57|nr:MULTISPECIES: dTDP-4-dehydrorhamnose reductase [Shouchella]MCM3378785.1 dTDP-4-dehydrorhamnose reductase [Shouchella rhizosphaerae]PAD17300.1 dTDP-4-dehydrorhamnose reductase [Shouchella clausii]